MSARSETRLPIRIFNGFASIFADNASPHFHPEQLLETAARKNRLSDFGEDFFLEGLQVLCNALNKEGDLHPLGRVIARTTLLAVLKNRLELSACWKRNPEVLNTEIVKPVFIVGLPRTGTTLLFNLLALDQRFQFLRAWEAVRPGLSGKDGKIVAKAVAEKKADIKFSHYLRSDLKKIHFLTWEMPEECIPLLNNSFECDYFALQFKAGSYSEWLRRHNHSPCYVYYRNQLKWLQNKKKGDRWLLKSPFHLTAFETLFDVFPDALIVHTHRDPARVVPSMGSLMYNHQAMTTYAVQRKDMGRAVIKLFAEILQEVMKLRERYTYNVLDIQYEDLVSNPMGSLEKIYCHMGETVSDDLKCRAETYLACNPKNKYGTHTYTLDEYGLTQETIDAEFDFYHQCFSFDEQF